MTVHAFIKTHSLPTYVVMTFAISWGGVLAVVGPDGFPGTPGDLERLLPAAVVAMIAGPSMTSILLTGLLSGKPGLDELLSRLLSWRVGARWYVAALLTAPLLMSAVLLGLSRVSTEFLPLILTSADKVSPLLFGLAVALAAGIFEEIGWTGFFIPRLRLRHSVLATGLIAGLIWAAWHLLVAFWASGTVSGPLSLVSFLLDPVLFLTAFRVLMVWVYDRTGSLLVAIVMHASLTASARILNSGIAGVPLLAFDLVWAAAVGVLVAAIAMTNRGRSKRLGNLDPALGSPQES